MTRFARAKGSNKRIPDEATSWQDMKKQHTSSPPNAKEESLSKKSVNSITKKPKKHGEQLFKGSSNKIHLNGIEIELAYFDGFPIKKSDADRLKQLKKDMISKGIARNEINVALKLERRRAEKALAREKKKVCFNCRNGGHTLSECPQLQSDSNIPQFQSGICFKCGSTEHTHFECKVTKGEKFRFAQCFICQEQGHIAKQCPNNDNGIYPNGGACNVCGDVNHFKKDCPLHQEDKAESRVVADKINEDSIESLEVRPSKSTATKKIKKKVVKF